MADPIESPWAALPSEDAKSCVWEVQESEGSFSRIAHVYGDTKADAARRATLLAAAPDLLDACQATLDRLDYIQNLWGKEGVTSTIAERLRAAIAKATEPQS